MRVRVQRVVPAVPADVFDYLTTLPNQADWMIEVLSVELDGPLEVGSRFRQEVGMRGAANEHTFEHEITELDENRVFEYRMVNGPYPTTMRFEVEPAGLGARVTATEDSSPPGLRYLVLRPAVRWVVKRRLAGDLNDLEAKLVGVPEEDECKSSRFALLKSIFRR